MEQLKLINEIFEVDQFAEIRITKSFVESKGGGNFWFSVIMSSFNRHYQGANLAVILEAILRDRRDEKGAAAIC